MKSKVKKSIALVSALSIVATTSAISVFAVDTSSDTEYTQFPFTKECEDPEIANGNTTWTDIYGQKFDGYSGDGFVYLTGNSLKFEVTVPEDDMYEVKVRYTQVLSKEGRKQTICINGTDYMVDFPYTDTWKDISFGMFRLKAGTNTIEIKPQYGYASYDTITVDKAQFPELKVDPTLSDKNATSETQSLMNYLCSVYGNGILSGQQEIYGGGNDGNTELEFDFIKNLTGELPAIRGFDFMNYNPLYGWDDKTTERVIEWVNDRNGIATASWHINVPLNFANYTLGDQVDWTECTYNEKSDFDTSKAIVEGTKEHDYVMLAIEDLAEQLTRLQDANVPIILRPFHEAEGNGGVNGEGAWFWWSKSGAEVYKELWKMLYTTLTEDYGLHNIIWEFNSYDYSTSGAWYPGDDYVDMVGFDKYNTVYNRHDGLTSGPNVDAISSTFYSLVNLTNGKKLVAMPENDTVPTIENMKTERAGWLYFCPWYGEHLMDASKNDPDTLKAIYQDDYCINLGDLPKDLYTNSDTPTPPTGMIDITTTVTKVTDEDITLEFVDNDKTYECTLKIADHFKNDEKISVGDTIIANGYGCGPVNYGDIDKWFANASLELKSKSTDNIVTSTPQIIPVYIDGTVTKISDDSITIVDENEKEYICPIDKDTEIDDNIVVGSKVKAFIFANFFDYTKVSSTTSISLVSSDITTTTNEFDMPVVLTGTVSEVDTENDTITVKFRFTKVIKGYSSKANVGDTVTASNMRDVIDDEWFETATIVITPATTVTTVTTPDDTTVTTSIQIGDSDNDKGVKGDTTCDGEVKSNDLLLLKKYLLGLSDLTPQALANADINGDGDVKSNDLLALKKFLLGLAEL